MREFVIATKALADENRLRIIMALRGGELCVCQIIEMLDLAPSTVSKHMSILRQARLIDARKDGRWVFYRLDKNSPASIVKTLNLVVASLSDSAKIKADAKRLKIIMKTPPEELCKSQGKR